MTLWLGLISLVMTCWGCHDDPATPGPDADADGDADIDADLDHDGDTDEPDRDGDVDGDSSTDAAPVPGSFTLIVEEARFLTERFCDIDDNGEEDNTLADMGSPAGEMLAMILNSALDSELDLVSRLMMHYPDIDDLAGPSDADILVITFGGVDIDNPPDPTDDFDGDETFYVGGDYVDPCGEPLYYYTEGYFEDGYGWARGEDVILPLGGFAGFTATESFGTFEPYGAGGEGVTCGYATIHALGEGADLWDGVDLTVLELLVTGGGPMGLPAVPGALPDLDLDGDGLEMFVVDDEGHIVRCVDGDHSVLDGRDCWRDEGMRDGFSFVLGMSAVSAHLAGLEHHWQDEVEGTCEAPPEESLWRFD